MKWLRNLFKKEKCKCGDPNCRKEIKATNAGRLYTVNYFTCGFVKNNILKLMNFNPNINKGR